MKTHFTKICIWLFLGFISFSSCSKDDDASVESNSKHSFIYKDAAGILVASKSYTYDLNGGYLNAIEASTASALFLTATGSYQDAGTVSVMNSNLTKTSNNMYVYQDATKPLTFLGNVDWNITGSTAVPAFGFSQNKGIPYFNGLAELAVVIAKGSGTIVDLSGRAGYADSVSVMISGAGRSVVKTVAGTAPNVIFQPAELAGLKATKNATWTVNSFNVRDALVNNKHYYFINETSYFKINVEIL